MFPRLYKAGHSITSTNSAPSGTPESVSGAIPTGRGSRSADDYITLGCRVVAGSSGDTCEIVPYWYAAEADTWIPMAKIKIPHPDDIDESYGGTITIQAPPADWIYFHVTSLSAGMTLSVDVWGSHETA